MLQWTDAHCHFDFPVFDQQRERHWQWCQTLGVSTLLIPGVTLRQSRVLPDLCRDHRWYWCAGLHPYFAHEHQWSHLDELADVARQPDCTAIGEFGLDYVIADSEEAKKQQWSLFDSQLALAQQLKLPVVLHVRKAHDQVAQRLRQRQFTEGGLVHAFSGSVQQAKAYLDRGLKLGLGGAITHPRASRLRRTVTSLPSDAWLLETDAPDMTPAFWQGPNSPAAIPLIAQVLAHVKRQSLAQIAAQNEQLFSRLFLKP
ncbi:hypothetical protein CHH28_11775 [Bacterioplanes sanyensis]|uniref:Hydrolase TatD n=1 Tax=Bacterioplanes sanyensis TaxID=1249553 RepID=A0A222FLC0_9GAMM|nr:TatD family hydrolase [Bacterioplanes sanyensis]ASP39314.1 hypothetical protein CHH28_11775 [Bacterioplanes sanyensis]